MREGFKEEEERDWQEEENQGDGVFFFSRRKTREKSL